MDCVSYPSANSAVVTLFGQTYSIPSYDARCGNVHFAPNARSHYDLANTQSVLSSCRAFGTGNGADPVSLVSNADWDVYASLAPDCQGRFLVWWMQNMPGYQSGRHFADGRPMNSLWPFLFY